jgi:hypothetical protein
MASLLSVQILVPQSFRDHCVGYLKDLAQCFGYVLKKGFGLAQSAESYSLCRLGGRLRLRLSDGCWNRAFCMKFAQKLLGYSAEFVVGEAADAEFNRSAPFVSTPPVDQNSPA